VIYTGQGKNHPGLFRRTLFVTNDELHWVREDLAMNVDDVLKIKARIRYRQSLQEATLYKIDSGIYVDFAEKQSAITEGQFVAFYLDDELIGSGVIS
jgi:tRNA-specific 2-thiouridylase